MKATRFGLLPDVIRRLVCGESRPDMVPAMRAELASGGLASREVRRLLETATELHIRGLRDAVLPFTELCNPRLAKAARAYVARMAEEPLPPLTIKTLGGFAVVSGGRAVHFTRRNSRVLLQLLLTADPRRLHEDVICEHLWPGGEPAKVKVNLQTCVRDLRRALDPYHEPRGRSYVVYDDEHYGLTLPDGSVFDARDFRAALKSCLRGALGRRGLSASRRRRLADALALFAGEYLPEQRYASFAVEVRESLHNLFQEGARVYANDRIAAGAFSEAIPILEGGLRLDPLWRDGVRLLMIARAKSRALLRALRVYREYEKRLRQELDLPPDRELRAAFKQLARVHD